MSETEDARWRADAALVYRNLRDVGAASAPTLVDRLFPVPVEAPETTKAAIRRQSLRRVYDAIVWMRHQGVAIWAVPDAAGTVFTLERPEAIVPAPRAPIDPVEPPLEEDFWHPVTG